MKNWLKYLKANSKKNGSLKNIKAFINKLENKKNRKIIFS